jgi:hypothetical protein
MWEVWYPRGGSTGMLHSRGRLAPTDVLLVHSVPEIISVDVRDADGNRIAHGSGLERTLQSPMCRLRREGARVTREDLWPTASDIGLPVLLPGGEVGILLSWWNADDHSEWRWQIELSNSTRR